MYESLLFYLINSLYNRYMFHLLSLIWWVCTLNMQLHRKDPLLLLLWLNRVQPTPGFCNITSTNLSLLWTSLTGRQDWGTSRLCFRSSTTHRRIYVTATLNPTDCVVLNAEKNHSWYEQARAFHNGYLRKLCGVNFGHTRSKVLYRKPKLLLWSEADHIPKVALRWTPSGKKIPGRPKNDLEHNCDREANHDLPTWREIQHVAKDK